uniref:Uncharacterized protein n=1 Tax=Rhizophora mucronata TaxID=61149 RepID=A0A2P2IIV6_RHIMU
MQLKFKPPKLLRLNWMWTIFLRTIF